MGARSTESSVGGCQGAARVSQGETTPRRSHYDETVRLGVALQRSGSYLIFHMHKFWDLIKFPTLPCSVQIHRSMSFYCKSFHFQWKHCPFQPILSKPLTRSGAKSLCGCEVYCDATCTVTDNAWPITREVPHARVTWRPLWNWTHYTLPLPLPLRRSAISLVARLAMMASKTRGETLPATICSKTLPLVPTLKNMCL